MVTVSFAAFKFILTETSPLLKKDLFPALHFVPLH